MTRARADRETDSLYAGLRGRYGPGSSLSNGYRTQAYFRREQRMVLAAVRARRGVVLDVGCGSGLMLQPLLEDGYRVVGVDYNADACAAAAGHGLAAVRGDAFALPIADASVDQIVSCQFFNQQRPEAVRCFVHEAGRCLRPGGRALLVWRNGRAWVHRIAHATLAVWDRIVARPTFPNFDHTLADIRRYAAECGLHPLSEEVTFPQWSWRSERVSGLAAAAIGASCFVVLEKTPAPA